MSGIVGCERGSNIVGRALESVERRNGVTGSCIGVQGLYGGLGVVWGLAVLYWVRGAILGVWEGCTGVWGFGKGDQGKGSWGEWGNAAGCTPGAEVGHVGTVFECKRERERHSRLVQPGARVRAEILKYRSQAPGNGER